jgi:hypothetical protein
VPKIYYICRVFMHRWVGLCVCKVYLKMKKLFVRSKQYFSVRVLNKKILNLLKKKSECIFPFLRRGGGVVIFNVHW